MFVSVQLLGSGKRAHPCAGVKFLTTVMSFIVLLHVMPLSCGYCCRLWVAWTVCFCCLLPLSLLFLLSFVSLCCGHFWKMNTHWWDVSFPQQGWTNRRSTSLIQVRIALSYEEKRVGTFAWLFYRHVLWSKANARRCSAPSGLWLVPEDKLWSSIAKCCVEGGEMPIWDTAERLLSSACVYTCVYKQK